MSALHLTVSVLVLGAALVLVAGLARCLRGRRRRMEQDEHERYLGL